MVDSPLFLSLKKSEFETIDITEGDILKLCPDGTIKRHTFEYSYYYGQKWCDYGCYSYASGLSNESANDEYLSELKSYALYQGMDDRVVDELLHNGFTLQEIEDYIYEF